MHLMVQRCQFNEYHVRLAKELQRDLLHLVSCQSAVVSSLIPRGIIDRSEFDRRLSELERALEAIRHSYIAARLERMENALETGANIRSEDHLSHAFFLFQIDAIVRLLKNATTIRENTSICQDLKNAWKRQRNKKRKPWKDLLKLQWPRFLSALKSMIIIGVGSIFVMVHRMARIFENGQWILIALCLTQGDTVGGAFTSMKMRLVGTLLGECHFIMSFPKNSKFSRFNVGIRDLFSRRYQYLSYIWDDRSMDVNIWLLEIVIKMELCSYRRCLYSSDD